MNWQPLNIKKKVIEGYMLQINGVRFTLVFGSWYFRKSWTLYAFGERFEIEFDLKQPNKAKAEANKLISNKLRSMLQVFDPECVIVAA